MNYFMISLLIWNFIVMFVYGTDKLLAKAHKRRISEMSLMLCSFLLGGIGAMFGMVVFNHKTSKRKFRFFVPITVVFEFLIMYWVMRYI